MMIRTQVYLPKSLYREIELVAKREKKPKAEIIRATLIQNINKTSSARTLGDELLELADLGKKLKLSGPTDLSTNHDKYLYEDE